LTALYHLIGENVSASPSPAMMNAAFTHLGIDASYSPRSIKRAKLSEAFGMMKLDHVSGANVTIPFKSSIVPLLDDLDAISAKINAVNGLVRLGERYSGFNTDVQGITEPLRSHGTSRVRRALLIGAGGAARAFCEAMDELGCTAITLAVRDLSRASSFLEEMTKAFPRVEFVSAQIGDLSDSDAELVFNASPMGSFGTPLAPRVAKALVPGTTVFDAVYRPVETELLSLASRLGCRIVRGHEMLLHQAAATLERWTDERAPLEVMRDALFRKLGLRIS